MSKLERWWGEYDLPIDAWSHWQIGPLSFFAKPYSDEWRFAWRSAGDSLAPVLQHESPASTEPDDNYAFTRYAMRHPGSTLVLRPRAADLPIVIRPETQLYVPAGEQSALFVSTIAWLTAAPENAADNSFVDIPIHRPTDTWFGSNTLQGELCYGARTNARTRLELLAPLRHRIITPVEIVNKGSDQLLVERLRVPVPLLTIYESDDNRLWSDAVRLSRSAGDAVAELGIRGRSKRLPKGIKEIAGPREQQPGNLIVEAFSRLFG